MTDPFSTGHVGAAPGGLQPPDGRTGGQRTPRSRRPGQASPLGAGKKSTKSGTGYHRTQRLPPHRKSTTCRSGPKCARSRSAAASVQDAAGSVSILAPLEQKPQGGKGFGIGHHGDALLRYSWASRRVSSETAGAPKVRAIDVMAGIVTGCPAARACAMALAPSVCTPHMRTSGFSDLSAVPGRP